jgi:CysZ protein
MIALLSQTIPLALRQLADRQTLAVLWRVLLLTLAIFVLLGGGLWWAVDRWLLQPQVGDNPHFYALAGLALTFAILVLFWFLFRAVAMAVMGLFTDAVVDSVEADHFPAAAANATPVSWQRGLAFGIKSALRALFWNLLASPLYLLALFTGIGLPIALIAVNAPLLGRDLETMVAARHPAAEPMPSARRWALGLTVATAFMIPVINLLAPVFGAALAVHMFHRDREPRP